MPAKKAAPATKRRRTSTRGDSAVATTAAPVDDSMPTSTRGTRTRKRAASTSSDGPASTASSDAPASSISSDTPASIVSTDTSIAGKTIVFSGKLSSSRAKVTSDAENAGAIVKTAVSGKTDILVTGPSAAAKVVSSAQALGVIVWTEDQFLAALKGTSPGAAAGKSPSTTSSTTSTKSTASESKSASAKKTPAAAPKKAAKAAKSKTAAVAKKDSDPPATPATPPPASPVPTPVKEEEIIVKGRAAVDSNCHLKDSHHVYVSDDGTVWDFLGNQTDIGNNNNKFYKIQLLAKDSGSHYAVYTRWGRVGSGHSGAKDQIIAEGAGLESCQAAFRSKYKSKSGNNWPSEPFVPKKGKYVKVEIDYGADAKAAASPAKKATKKTDPPVEKKACTLARPVQSLMQLIFDVKTFTEDVVKMKYDVNKMPLGKLTEAQIKVGLQALQDIESLIEASQAHGAKLLEANNTFYTAIPHAFGMKRPPVLSTMEHVKEKLKLLEILSDLKLTTELIKTEADKTASDQSIDDINYNSLDTGLTAVPKSSKEYKMVDTYLKNTHGKTHHSYSLEIEDLFVVDKSSLPFVDDKDVSPDTTMLLWHGSRLSNWTSILKQGLRIAPPEAPVTGYMFGKGVYFADMVSKSANYCFTNRNNNTGLLMLCEVVLGNEDQRHKILSSDSQLPRTLPKGKYSAIGCGRHGPCPKKNITTGTATVPQGKGVDTGIQNDKGYTLQYNEYIVYDTTRIKLKYLLRTKFNYKH